MGEGELEHDFTNIYMKLAMRNSEKVVGTFKTETKC